MRQHVLAVFPHPDDETLGKAGTVARYTKTGTPVTLICATLGQMGRNMGKPFFANRETLPGIRERELRDACDILGIHDLRLLGLRDKTLEFEDPELLADRVWQVMREIEPSTVLTYYPAHGVHPDHDALSAAAVRAVRRLPSAERPIVYGSAVTRDAAQVLGPPDVVNDVTDVLDIKLAAMRAHRSQTESMMEQIEEQRHGDRATRDQLGSLLLTEKFWIVPVSG